jgi:hypothetical protein
LTVSGSVGTFKEYDVRAKHVPLASSAYFEGWFLSRVNFLPKFKMQIPAFEGPVLRMWAQK